MNPEIESIAKAIELLASALRYTLADQSSNAYDEINHAQEALSFVKVDWRFAIS